MTTSASTATPSLRPTPGQTVGPFFGMALPYPGGNELVPPGSSGAVRLHGYVRDGAGVPVPDAMIEIGQADPGGQLVRATGSLYRDGWTFTGWGRAATDLTGHYTFSTLPPGPIDGGAAFFAVTVFARGLLDRLFTRAYLPTDTHDASSGFGQDALLARVPAGRRQTLIAARDQTGYRFDIHLQGDDETVFLDFGAR